MGDAKKTVMIVDADRAHAMALARALEKQNYQVVTAQSSDDAALVAAEGKIDVLVTDHSYPDIDGVELTRRVKSSRGDIRVVMCSRALDLDVYLKEMNFGAEDCLEKPCKPEDVLRVIETSYRRSVEHQSKAN